MKRTGDVKAPWRRINWGRVVLAVAVVATFVVLLILGTRPA